jgi:hypothetical protein
MSYFLIEPRDEETFLDEEKGALRLNNDDYLELLQTAKDLGIFEELMKQIDFSCPKCRSFSIPAAAFYEAVIDRIDLDCVYEIIHGLTEKVYLTDEEWIKYSNHGQESVDIIKDAVIVETDGEIYRFVADEILFKLDDTCDCSSGISDFRSEE